MTWIQKLFSFRWPYGTHENLPEEQPMSTLLEKFHKILCESGVPAEFHAVTNRMILGHVLRLHQYKSMRQELRSFIGAEAERLVQEKMQCLKHNYEAQVLLWRAVYCWIETNDIARAAYRHEISTADLQWVISTFEGTDMLVGLPTVAKSHWSRTPLTRDEVAAVVAHSKVQGMIRNLLQFKKTGVIWGYDQGITKDDLKCDLEYKAVTTTLCYEADRRSKWHLINVVAMSLDNEVKNMMRKSTAKDSGRVVEVVDETDLCETDEKTGKRARGVSLSRIVPLTKVNDSGEEYEAGAALADLSFAGTRAVQDAISKMSSILAEKTHVMDYLKVAVLGEHNQDFEDWLDRQKTPRKTEEDMLIKLARRFFNISPDEMKLMQEVVVG